MTLKVTRGHLWILRLTFDIDCLHTKFDDSIFSHPETWFGLHKVEMGHVTVTTRPWPHPFQEWFIIHRLERVCSAYVPNLKSLSPHIMKMGKVMQKVENGVICGSCRSFNHHNDNCFTALFPGPPRWDFIVQGKINRHRHTDHPAGRHSIMTNQCPPPPSPIFYSPDALAAAQLTVSKHWRHCRSFKVTGNNSIR